MSSRHWSTTPEGGLVARCTIFIYQKIQKGEEEGGWRSFFDEHNHKFSDTEAGEHDLELYGLFKEFETKLEEAFEDFASEEGMSAHDISRIIGNVDDTSPQASKCVKRLLLSFSYDKFCSIMRDKAKRTLTELKVSENRDMPDDISSGSTKSAWETKK